MDKGSPAMELGALRAEDLAEVCAIEIESFSTPWPRSLFEEELRRPELCFWLALRDPAAPPGSRLAAYGGFWKAVDEAHFTNVAVHPSRRRLGLGRRMLRSLLDKARERGCLSATLEVRPSNAAALALYTSEGFSPAAIRPRYYSDDGEDALILWKRPL
ncbi:MAG TPA: ribosomal protein S18-alanine N-acetyltransferase [bacterium]|jgi:ribosomal-protein-alanine N-acetyltransferase|nr:ribosomal protein S18-alanine N-acetyltransferase [bacterium]